MFSVSITHNSKIRELSDGNRVIETELSFGQTTFLLWVSPFLSYELWKLRIELSNLVGQTTSKVLVFFFFFLGQGFFGVTSLGFVDVVCVTRVLGFDTSV